MPRPKFRSNQAGRKGQKSYKHNKHGGSFKKNKSSADLANPDGRKFKYIRRNQEQVELLRRQQKLENDFQERNSARQVDNEEVESSSAEEIDPMEQLMSTFSTTNNFSARKKSAIDSSDSEIGDEEVDEELGEEEETAILDDEEDGESDSDDDTPFPEKFEEQSQPRGRKYRSSEEEEEEEQHVEENSDDDLPEDTVLRPEESTERKTFNDSFENENENDSDDEGNDDGNSESENQDENIRDSEHDVFSLHLGYDLSSDLLECVSTTHHSLKESLNWPNLGRIQVEIPTIEKEQVNASAKKKKLTLLDDDTEYAREGTLPTLFDTNNVNLAELNVKVQIKSNVATANKDNLSENYPVFSPLQAELFSIINNYQDLFYSMRTHENGEQIRFIYTLHALNHILKTRAKVLNHNLKLKLMSAENPRATAVIPDRYRDQGLFRTKVLIIAPFRESALRIVNNLIALLFPDSEKGSGNKQVMHYKRFLEEFGGQTLHFPKRNPKPEDYEQTFIGNSDDTFRIGVTLTRKSIKLYSDFYSSDILIVSPLGLRMIVGAPGDKERDYDFLASIELLILDQADIFMAQNWDHLLHVLDHLHLQPQSARNTDFSRVRSWCLNGWTRFYRQTLLFTTHELPEFRSLFNSRCSNYRGKVRLANSIEDGSIKHVAVQIPQVFHRIDVTSFQSSFDQRFDHFVNTILPQFKSAAKAHCLILVPSYFDFVRIRNYMKKETINYVQICEYTKVNIYNYIFLLKSI